MMWRGSVQGDDGIEVGVSVCRLSRSWVILGKDELVKTAVVDVEVRDDKW